MRLFFAALLVLIVLLIFTVPASFAGENLKLNPKIDFNSDSEDGRLITGDSMDAGFTSGKPAYVIMYGEACFNSKRQARRTVEEAPHAAAFQGSPEMLSQLVITDHAAKARLRTQVRRHVLVDE